jgi:hypothetical protein
MRPVGRALESKVPKDPFRSRAEAEASFGLLSRLGHHSPGGPRRMVNETAKAANENAESPNLSRACRKHETMVATHGFGRFFRAPRSMLRQFECRI